MIGPSASSSMQKPRHVKGEMMLIDAGGVSYVEEQLGTSNLEQIA